LFLAGPESAGAQPGPACYRYAHINVDKGLGFTFTRIHLRKGGPLAVTDANLLLGRLISDYFPKIFGKSEKEPLDAEASRIAFEKVAKDINESHEMSLDLDEIVYGLVQFTHL